MPLQCVLKNCPWYILIYRMRPLRWFALTFTMLSALIPQLACFLPEQRVMTASEIECCEHMAGECGQAFMQAHECCAGTVRLEVAMVAKACREVSTPEEFTALALSPELPGLPHAIYVVPLLSEANHAPPPHPVSPSPILRI